MTSDPVTLSGEELSVDDVEAFTGGRLSADAPETQRLLDAAVAAARRYCGWHVCPVWVAHDLVLDGHGGRVLRLPTCRLINVDDLVEDDTAIDVATLHWSADGQVRKPGGRWWTHHYRGIEVTITDGYTEEEAADWRQAVLTMVDLMSTGGRPDSELVVKKVDDVQYQWTPATGADQALLSVASTLDGYLVGKVYFA